MFRINFKQFFVFVFTAVVAISCDNSPASSEEEHLDVDGLSIEHNGTEVYRELEGEVVINNISLGVNDTLHLTVHFLDHEGNEIEHDEEEEDHEDGLSISGFDSNIAIVEAEDHEEEEDDHDHDEEEHGNAIHVIGVSSGSTSFQLELMHEGHADYTSTNLVPVVVN